MAEGDYFVNGIKVRADGAVYTTTTANMADLANTSDAAKGDALIGVKLDATGSVARTQHDRNEQLPMRSDFGSDANFDTAVAAIASPQLSALQSKFVQSGTGASSRTVSAKLGEVQLSVTDFGVSVSNSAAANSTALALAITRATALCSSGGATLYFPPNATAYALEPLNLDTTAKRIFLVGDGPRASRIEISGGSTGAGTYAINFSASDNSFGGLLDIGITATDAYEAVFHVNEPHNQFQLARVYLDGSSACTYALKATGGTQLFIDWIYTTGLTSFNFYFLNQAADSFIQVVGGNHDIGTDGIAFTSSTASGGCLTLTGGRFETQTSKKLFKYTVTQETHLRINGSFFTGGSATTLVNTTSGTAIQYHIDGAFNGAPTSVYTDDNSSANDIAVTDNAQRSILETSKVFYSDVRFRGPTGVACKARFKSGTQTEFSIFGGGDSNWYFRDETNTKNMWLANSTVGLQMQTERHQCAQGADVVAAGNLVLGTDGNRFRITGTTQIDRMSSLSWQGGAIVTLHFTDSVTVVHGNADSGTNRTINLAGAANFSATANDQLTLQYDETDTAWYEISRTVI